MKHEQLFVKVKANLTGKREEIQMSFSPNLKSNNWLWEQTDKSYQLAFMYGLLKVARNVTRIIKYSNENENQKLPLTNLARNLEAGMQLTPD